MNIKESYSTKEKYENPLVGRYASKEMSYIWSPQKKFSTWRKLWLALAKSEKELGLKITDEQIKQMEENLENIDFEVVSKKEKELRHDVMSHIFAFGEVAPKAKPIIHLGATSCFVGDNTDIIQMKESLILVKKDLLNFMNLLRNFAMENRDIPTLGFTHYQPAQLTTVGKRATLWLQDFLYDYQQVERMIDEIPMRGVKGTTGTQASFLELFDGDGKKCRELDTKVCEMMGFDKKVSVSGQTYTRKIDFFVLSVLNGIAASANKMAVDIRLLQNLKEIEEPFESKQVGSSAMAYKRNPMRCERICSLSRFVMSLIENASNTHANQWFERTLDDSANRRLSIPESFLGTDVILNTLSNVVDGLKVWPLVIRKHVDAELPFMATENILMAAVKEGGDRQLLHEVIRELSMEAGIQVKQYGKDNDLIERIKNCKDFEFIKDKIDSMMEPSNFIGRSIQQVEEFISEDIDPILKKNKDIISKQSQELNV
eukprot:gene10937-3643_t